MNLPDPNKDRPAEAANPAQEGDEQEMIRVPLRPPAPPPEPGEADEGGEASVAVKFGAVLYCLFCFAIGLFLLVYPWMPGWDRNSIFQLRPEWTGLLTSVQFRGAVSGLGILNLFAAVSETLSLRRFSSR